MAIFYPYVVQCACGEAITTNLADGVNADRTPMYRQQIIDGVFHRVACPKCKRVATVEKSFFYTDLKRNAFFQVKPRQDRHLWKKVSVGLEEATAAIPEAVAPAAGRNLRAVFGMAELREKLVAQDLKLDDRAVELLKVLILNEHPFLLRKPRLRLSLERASEEALEFVAAYDLDDATFRLSTPKAEAMAFARQRQKLKSWTRKAHPAAPLMELQGDHWVNMWRWSPQPSALDLLKAYASELRAGRTIDATTQQFANMCRVLPRGGSLPGWAKQDLQVLFDDARKRKDGPVQDALFEVRFGKPLEDDWAYNDDQDDIDTLWKLFRALPPSNVEGNVAVNQIFLDVGEGGGFYIPTTHDIYIGSRSLSDRESFEDVVRHEVGHGVHEQRKVLVDRWLEAEFGWRMFPVNPQGVASWVGLMGGWAQWGVTAAQQAEVISYLQAAIGPGSAWNPGPNPSSPAGHPWWRPDFGPRVAHERSGAHWYNNHPNWYRHGGKAFFLNYWYRTLVVVDHDALALVAQMPSPYAAMSPYEFFAELYALYYDLDDPRRPVVPAAVGAWFDANVEPPPAPPAMPAMPSAPEEWEGIARPKGEA